MKSQQKNKILSWFIFIRHKKDQIFKSCMLNLLNAVNNIFFLFQSYSYELLYKNDYIMWQTASTFWHFSHVIIIQDKIAWKSGGFSGYI